MDGSREELLAYAGGAAHEHVRVALGDEGDVLSQSPHCLALADQAIHVGVAVGPDPLDCEISQRGSLFVSEHRDQDELISELDDVTGAELAAIDGSASMLQQALAAILQLEVLIACASNGELFARKKARLERQARLTEVGPTPLKR